MGVMGKFSELEYERIDIDALKEDCRELFSAFETVRDAEGQNKIITEINRIRNRCDSMISLARIRHTLDTADEFYDKENDFVDEAAPLFQGIVNDFYKLLVQSRFREELEKKWGKQLFKIAELQLQTFSDEVIADLQEENKLTSRYEKLKAEAVIMFEGEERNLFQMGPFTVSRDRETRKRAQEAVAAFYAENEAVFDSIYNDLVQLRHRTARKLGFKNFVKLGYARMSRTDYGEEQTANYRQQVLESIVPLASRLRKRQAQRLGLHSLKYYDELLGFRTGNPTPQGDPKWILKQGRRMYKELSPETDEFFQFMIDNELLDLETKKGKAYGGYCDYMAEFQFPFIFSNFNGTSEDIGVLTHEAGHAFQAYMSRGFEIPEYHFPTTEACEIHSMSMEFLTWPWMEIFFGKEQSKYKFSQLNEALLFIPYGVTVDEFQHWVYEHPNVTPAERKAAWRRIEKKYLPDKDYDSNGFLDKGGFWFRQGHIFSDPFYYIDYALAQICAFEFWARSEENRQRAWKDYLTLCEMGGRLSFIELIKLANLHNPFESGTIEKIIAPISKWIDQIDDLQLDEE